MYYQVFVYCEFLEDFRSWGPPHDSKRRAEKQASTTELDTRIVPVKIKGVF